MSKKADTTKKPGFTKLVLNAINEWEGTPEELGRCLQLAQGRPCKEQQLARARLVAKEQTKALLQYEEEEISNFLSRVRIPEPRERVTYD